jgi:hypothetical protein
MKTMRTSVANKSQMMMSTITGAAESQFTAQTTTGSFTTMTNSAASAIA